MTPETARPLRGLPGWAAGCLVAGAAAVVWWASGAGRYEGPDYMIGPYEIPVALEYALGGVALTLAIAVLATHPTPRASRGLSPSTVTRLVIAAAVATGLWRVMTLGGGGANIGGGAAALLGPFIVAGLLVAAVNAERRVRHASLRQFCSADGNRRHLNLAALYRVEEGQISTAKVYDERD